MADEDEDDKVPLLSAVDNSHFTYFATPRMLDVSEPGTSNCDPSIDARLNNPQFSTGSHLPADSPLLGQTNANDDQNILAVFVVAFDTRAGNIVEWCIPSDCDLEGVEFKAMPSGAHRIYKDFIYFKQSVWYGLACFEHKPVESEIERRARMKSVCILAASYTSLYKHVEFLEDQVKKLLDAPGNYDQLQMFYERRKAVLPSTANPDAISPIPIERLPGLRWPAEMQVVHPTGSFSLFTKFFGEKVFVIWKFALLKKRILFFSPPPIGTVCYRVYCSSCLTQHNIPEIGKLVVQPIFYVTVADIDSLETETSYVACTTDKIFESKPHLYDIYIDNQNLKCYNPSTQKLLNITASDREHYRKLQARLREVTLYNTNSSEDEENTITAHFKQLNNHLLRTLLDISYSQNKQVNSKQVQALGFDLDTDRTFLQELLTSHGIDAHLADSSPCCSL